MVFLSRSFVTQVWRSLVEGQKHRKMLWTVGYRGLNDYPFWFDDTEFDTPEKRGALISEAVQRQIDVVRNLTGLLAPSEYNIKGILVISLFSLLRILCVSECVICSQWSRRSTPTRVHLSLVRNERFVQARIFQSSI
jgi:hypothetical protein